MNSCWALQTRFASIGLVIEMLDWLPLPMAVCVEMAASATSPTRANAGNLPPSAPKNRFRFMMIALLPTNWGAPPWVGQLRAPARTPKAAHACRTSNLHNSLVEA